VHCPHCHQENPPRARFCLACGLRLRLTCGGCGTELPGQARFCIECGQPTGLLAAGEPARAQTVAGEAARAQTVAGEAAAEALLPAGPPVAAGPARVILERGEVLEDHARGARRDRRAGGQERLRGQIGRAHV